MASNFEMSKPYISQTTTIMWQTFKSLLVLLMAPSSHPPSYEYTLKEPGYDQGARFLLDSWGQTVEMRRQPSGKRISPHILNLVKEIEAVSQ